MFKLQKKIIKIKNFFLKKVWLVKKKKKND
jgi:hypothetical protein